LSQDAAHLGGSGAHASIIHYGPEIDVE
jgi:hypothetical protein